MNKDLIEQIDARLKQLGHNRTWLAEQLGMTKENLSRTINGKVEMSETHLQEISRILQRELIINGKE